MSEYVKKEYVSIEGVLASMVEAGVIRGFQLDESGQAGTVFTSNYRQLAKCLSLVYDADSFVSATGITVCRGSRTIVRLVAPCDWEAGVDAARIVHELTGETVLPGVAANARKLVKWVGPAQPTSPSDWHLMQGKSYGYHNCTPALLDYAVMYDVKRCYYTLLTRLPSLRVHYSDRLPVQFSPMKPEEWSRWKDVLVAVKDNKKLRNSMYGVILGSVTGEGPRMYRKGELCDMTQRFGPFRAAGLLITRTEWELCQEASEETGSVYSMADCVVTLGDRPKAWDKVGMEVEKRAEGSSNICMRGIYKVGYAATQYYQWGSRNRVYEPNKPKPERVFYREWLS